MDQNQPGAARAQPQSSIARPGATQPGTTHPGAGQPGTGQPGTGQAPPAAPPRQHVLRRTRAGGVWVALALSAVVLLLLLVFILENGHRADIAFLGAHVSLPLGVALLLAAVAGAVVVIIPGTARIIQLRITARRHRQIDAAAATPAAPPQAGPGQAA